MRTLLLIACLSLFAASCDGGADGPPPVASPSRTHTGGVTSSPTTPAVTPSPTPSASSSPEITPPLQLPRGAPTRIEDPASIALIASGDRAPLAPPGAEITSVSVLATPDDPVDQIAFAWRRGEDPFASQQGFVLWQRQDPDPAWQALYAFTDGPATGVLGIDLDSADLTADGVPDLLTFEQTGGTGACGTWRVIAPRPGAADQVFRKETCDTTIAIAGDGLQVREAVFGPDDAHCCPSAFRVSRLEWDGRTFVRTHSEVVGSPS